MCFERTKKKVEPFRFGFKVMRKKGNAYYSAYAETGEMSGGFFGTFYRIPKRKWVDEMPWRSEDLLLKQNPRDTNEYGNGKANVGWHVLTNLNQAMEFRRIHVGSSGIIVRVECYGLEPPYGLGFVYDKPAGRFQFMRILEEIK